MLGLDREFGSGVLLGTWPRVRRANSESQVEGQDFYLLSSSERMEEKQQQQHLTSITTEVYLHGTTKRDVKAPTNTFPTPPSLCCFFFFYTILFSGITFNLIFLSS